MAYDAIYVTVFKSTHFHLSTLETECFQTSSLLKLFSKDSVFIGVFRCFSVDDRQKHIIKYAFSNEIALVWQGLITEPVTKVVKNGFSYCHKPSFWQKGCPGDLFNFQAY